MQDARRDLWSAGLGMHSQYLEQQRPTLQYLQRLKLLADFRKAKKSVRHSVNLLNHAKVEIRFAGHKKPCKDIINFLGPPKASIKCTCCSHSLTSNNT